MGVVTGLGELVGYSLRFVSGRWAERSGRYWPITIFGYVVQMASMPALALAGSWPAAALLIVLERTGKAICNPPRDVMLSHAGRHLGGVGWAFGLFTAAYGIAWFAGSAIIGILYHYTLAGTVAFCVLAEMAALPFSFHVRRSRRPPAG